VRERCGCQVVDIETPIELEVCGSGVGARCWTLKPLLIF
jgi:hypothetical protein